MKYLHKISQCKDEIMWEEGSQNQYVNLSVVALDT